MRTHWLKRRIRHTVLIATLMLNVSFWIASAAWAKYRPPKNPSAPKTTVTNTTRGGSCENNTSIGLTALVPLSHIGQTMSQHPTFVWFVPDRASHRLEFRLFTTTGQPLYRTQMQSRSGIMSIALPFDQPGLAIGQSYVWQVVLICPSNVRVIETAQISIVQPPSKVSAQLEATQTTQQRIDRFAESGLWYDALAEARKSSQPAVLNLLNSLADLEGQSFKNWSDRLKRIQVILQQPEKQRQG